jgi:hypothetical protein
MAAHDCCFEDAGDEASERQSKATSNDVSASRSATRDHGELQWQWMRHRSAAAAFALLNARDG